MSVVHTNAFEGKTFEGETREKLDLDAINQRLRDAVNGGAFDGAGQGAKTEPPDANARANGSAGKAGQGEAFDPRFTFTSIDSIKEPILDGAFAIHGLLPASGFAAFYGPPGCGKSFGTLHTMLHVATGRDYNGRPTEKSHVIYLVAEGGKLFRNRVLAAKRALGIEEGKAAFDLIFARPNLGTDNKDADLLRDAIEAQRRGPYEKLPLIVVVDTLSRTMKGAKEDEAGLGTFMDNCSKIEEAFGGLSIAVHHTGKDLERGLRGWSGLDGGCDAEWLFKKLRDGISEIIAKKVRDGQDNIGWKVKRETVQLGVDTKHKLPVTTQVVSIHTKPAPIDESAGEAAASKQPSKSKVKAIREFDDAFKEAMIDHGQNYRIDDDPTAPIVRAVTTKAIRPFFAKRWAIEEPDKRKRQRKVSEGFNGALKTLPLPYCTRVEDDGARCWVWKLS
jgi:AAA domain